jgi:hypothetical protein
MKRKSNDLINTNSPTNNNSTNPTNTTTSTNTTANTQQPFLSAQQLSLSCASNSQQTSANDSSSLSILPNANPGIQTNKNEATGSSSSSGGQNMAFYQNFQQIQQQFQLQHNVDPSTATAMATQFLLNTITAVNSPLANMIATTTALLTPSSASANNNTRFFFVFFYYLVFKNKKTMYLVINLISYSFNNQIECF